MWEKAAKKYLLALIYVPNKYKSQKICETIVSENYIMLQFTADEYQMQNICENIVNDYSFTLKFITDSHNTLLNM